MLDNHWSTLFDLLPDFGLQLGMALVCGFLLGLEREMKDKPAGLRTIMLITIGATLYMFVSRLIPMLFDDPPDVVAADPARIAAQVVSGIGFLGAGAIIQARGAIHGLTTAASIWVAAGVGLCIGVGFPFLALGVTLIVLGVLVLLNLFERWLNRRVPERVLKLLVVKDSLTRDLVRATLADHNVHSEDISFRTYDDEYSLLTSRLHAARGLSERLLRALFKIDGVRGLPTEPDADDRHPDAASDA